MPRELLLADDHHVDGQIRHAGAVVELLRRGRIRINENLLRGSIVFDRPLVPEKVARKEDVIDHVQTEVSRSDGQPSGRVRNEGDRRVLEERITDYGLGVDSECHCVANLLERVSSNPLS